MIGILVFAFAVVVVLATSLFKNVDMSSRTKNLIAAVLSVVGGAVAAGIQSEWDFASYGTTDLLETVLLVYGAAQAMYQFLLKDTRADAVLEAAGTGGE